MKAAAGMRRVALVSPLGGCGRTTLAAHLASLLAERGHGVLAIDLSAQNALALHLGLLESQADAPLGVPVRGWRDSVSEEAWWGEAALESSQGVRLLPHGAWKYACSVSDDPPDGWLSQQLDLLDLPGPGVMLLDTPALPAALALQAARCADLVLLLLDASARSLHWPQPVQALGETLPPGTQWGVLVTGVDARSASRMAALKTLREQWQQRLLPYPLHRDESVQLAQERGVCVHQHAPHSQAAHDFQGIADWVERQLGLQRKTRESA